MDLKVCRICGGNIQLKCILEDSILANKLLVCVNIDIYSGDFLPKFICEQCDKNLDICYRLKKQCESTQKGLMLAMQRPQNVSLEIIPLQNEESSNEYTDCGKIDLSQCSDNIFESIKLYDSSSKKEVLMNNTNASQRNSDTITEDLKTDDSRFEENNVSCTRINNEIVTYEESKIICASKVKQVTEISSAPEYCSIDLLSLSGTSSYDCDDLTNQEVESKLTDLTCDTCHEVFTNHHDYRIHIKHHGLQRFQCIQCCKFFPSRFRLKRHEETHNDAPSHQCSYCNRNYRALYNLQRHIRSVHLGKKNYECDVCNANFSRVDSLKRHLLLHSDEKKFLCSLCSQSFKTKDYLYAHHKSHHAEKSDFTLKSKRIKKDKCNKNQCGYCGKLFKSSFAFKNHLLIHSNEKPHKCDTCNKTFRTIAALTIHQRIHNDYRPYQCELCLKSFKQTSHLKEHRAIHLDNAPKHVCSICKASFAKKGNFKAHTLTHAKEKAFKCAYCAAEFNFMHLLKRHAHRVHCRSVYEVYMLNDIDGTCEKDEEIKNCDVFHNEIYHYIDTVADGDCNEFQENPVHFVNELEEIFSPQDTQISYEQKCVASSCEPIIENIGMNSSNCLQTQSTNENIIEQVIYNEI